MRMLIFRKTEDVKGHIWNLRFRVGHAILPGSHKHVSVFETDLECVKDGRCARDSQLRSLLEKARRLV